MTDSVVASTLGQTKFSSLISDGGLRVRIGPFNAHIQAPVSALHEPLYRLYADYPLLDANCVYSFHARIEAKRRLPRWYRPLVRFSIDGRIPHEDMPAEQALAVLEWGMNLVIAMRSHCFLMLHSAVLERDGHYGRTVRLSLP